jgi:hypothetical protein
MTRENIENNVSDGEWGNFQIPSVFSKYKINTGVDVQTKELNITSWYFPHGFWGKWELFGIQFWGKMGNIFTCNYTCYLLK